MRVRGDRVRWSVCLRGHECEPRQYGDEATVNRRGGAKDKDVLRGVSQALRRLCALRLRGQHLRAG
jgi:hypothetical protein